MAAVAKEIRVSDAVWFKPWTWGKSHVIQVKPNAFIDYVKTWQDYRQTPRGQDMDRGIRQMADAPSPWSKLPYKDN